MLIKQLLLKNGTIILELVKYANQPPEFFFHVDLESYDKIKYL